MESSEMVACMRLLDQWMLPLLYASCMTYLLFPSLGAICTVIVMSLSPVMAPSFASWAVFLQDLLFTCNADEFRELPFELLHAGRNNETLHLDTNLPAYRRETDGNEQKLNFWLQNWKGSREQAAGCLYCSWILGLTGVGAQPPICVASGVSAWMDSQLAFTSLWQVDSLSFCWMSSQLPSSVLGMKAQQPARGGLSNCLCEQWKETLFSEQRHVLLVLKQSYSTRMKSDSREHKFQTRRTLTQAEEDTHQCKDSTRCFHTLWSVPNREQSLQ